MTTTWSLPATDSRTVESALEELVLRTQSLSAHLVDRAGRLVASVGRPAEYDLTTFASLAAADLAANDELARLIGEPRVDGVACLGSLRSMVSTQVGEGLVLCVIFDRNSSLGIVRHRMRRAAERLWAVFRHLAERETEAPVASEAHGAFGESAVEAVDELLGGAD